MSDGAVKERGKGNERIPPSPPYREKGSQKETASPYPFPRARMHVCAQAQGSAAPTPARVREGKGKVISADEMDGFIMHDRHDSVQIAMIALRIPRINYDANGRRYNNPRIMRAVRGEIGDGVFRELICQQWHENRSDGRPRDFAAAFMAKLYAKRDEIRGMRRAAEGGAA